MTASDTSDVCAAVINKPNLFPLSLNMTALVSKITQIDSLKSKKTKQTSKKKKNTLCGVKTLQSVEFDSVQLQQSNKRGKQAVGEARFSETRSKTMFVSLSFGLLPRCGRLWTTTQMLLQMLTGSAWPSDKQNGWCRSQPALLQTSEDEPCCSGLASFSEAALISC